MAGAGPIDPDQDPAARAGPGPPAGQLGERLAEHGDVVGGGVAAGVALAQHDRQRLTGALSAVVDEREQRMEAEGLVERWRGLFLV